MDGMHLGGVLFSWPGFPVMAGFVPYLLNEGTSCRNSSERAAWFKKEL